MRKIVLLVFATLTISAFGQKIEGLTVVKGKGCCDSIQFEEIRNDTTIQVSYVNPNKSEKKTAFYLNEKLFDKRILLTINPNKIKLIDIKSNEVKIDSIKYSGQVFFQLEKDYNPTFISLTDLKLKYTNLKNKPSIFMIDNNIINGDYSKCIVDANYILEIIVEIIEDKEENLKINLIKIKTKTDENIRELKTKHIRLR